MSTSRKIPLLQQKRLPKRRGWKKSFYHFSHRQSPISSMQVTKILQSSSISTWRTLTDVLHYCKFIEYFHRFSTNVSLSRTTHSLPSALARDFYLISSQLPYLNPLTTSSSL